MAEQTRIICVQVRTRPIRDGLDAVLRSLPTVYYYIFSRFSHRIEASEIIVFGVLIKADYHTAVLETTMLTSPLIG